VLCYLNNISRAVLSNISRAVLSNNTSLAVFSAPVPP